MMPSWICESPENERRAVAIAEEVLERNFDILCFQKAFDVSARRVLRRMLAKRFPYAYGPANNGFFKLTSGVMIFSKHLLAGYREIQFDGCSSWECFSRKGALLLSGSCNGTPFRLIATHLQGEEGPTFTVQNQAIRNSQVRQIYQRLIVPNLQPAAPFIVCGDFGTPRFTDNDRKAETKAYRLMLRTLEAENGAEPRITLDDSRTHNDVVMDDTGRRNELDYILVRPSGHDVRVEREVLIMRHPGWDSHNPQRKDLSYRRAVAATIEFRGGPSTR